MLIIRMMEGAVIKWGKDDTIWHQGDLLGLALIFLYLILSENGQTQQPQHF